MVRVVERLRVRRFGLPEARRLADEVGADKTSLRALVRELFGDDVEVRKRAADVARRVTDHGGGPMERYADELAGLLESLPPEEARTRWHLALVVARSTHTSMQRIRAARMMSVLAEDKSNAVRCSAVEGLGTLALQDATLRDDAEGLLERFLWDGTPAMKSRARQVWKKLGKKYEDR